MPETLKLKLVTEPQNQPLSLNEAKAFLKLGDQLETRRSVFC